MLKFTPREIQKQEFKKVIRGFDTVEVETFLEMVSDEFELLLRTKNDLQEKVTKYGTELEKYKEVEGSLQETLVEAKRTSTQSLEASKREAETILREAESKAQKIIEDAHREANQLRDEIAMLKKQRESFVRRLKEWVRVLELDEIESKDSEEAASHMNEKPGIEKTAGDPSGGVRTTQSKDDEPELSLVSEESQPSNSREDISSQTEPDTLEEQSILNPETQTEGDNPVSQIHDGFNMIDKIIDEEEQDSKDKPDSGPVS